MPSNALAASSSSIINGLFIWGVRFSSQQRNARKTGEVVAGFERTGEVVAGFERRTYENGTVLLQLMQLKPQASFSASTPNLSDSLAAACAV
jgi:hypothetical protein